MTRRQRCERSSDEELLAAMVRGQETALEVLYERHAGAVLALAYRMVGMRGPAEGVVKVAFLSAWADGATYRPERGSVRAWLLQIAHDRAADVLRDVAPIQASAVRRPPGDELAEQARVAELAYFGGYDRAEIATMLALPAPSVRRRMRTELEAWTALDRSVGVGAEHARYCDDVAAYALGALTRGEAVELERHLRSCEACGRDLERFRAVVERLATSVEPQTPRGQLKQDVLRRIREPGGGAGPAKRPWLATGALASVAIVAGLYSLRPPAAPVDPARAPGASATLVREGDAGVLRTTRLAPLDDGVYVLWADRGNGPVYAASFNTGPGGRARLGLSGLARVKRLTVTREAVSRFARPTTAPVLTLQVR